MSSNDVLDGRLFGPGQPCFGCAPDHPQGLRLAFSRIEGGVETRFSPNAQQQGPLGIMHGGLVMTVADETAAWAVIAQTGKFGFTTQVEGRFAAPVRIEREVVARARVTKDLRRVVVTSVEVVQDERACFTATVRFALLDKAAAEKLMGTALPEAWARFSRVD